MTDNIIRILLVPSVKLCFRSAGLRNDLSYALNVKPLISKT